MLLQVHRLPKGTAILTLGDVWHRLYFLHTGLGYAYYAMQEEGITSCFVKEGDFVYSSQSFLKQKTTQEAILLHEESVLVSITFNDLQATFKAYPHY